MFFGDCFGAYRSNETNILLKKLTLPQLLKKAQDVFNSYIRNRDEEQPCISCGKHKDAYDAGHYVPVSKSSFLRFHEWNVNKECKGCNHFDESHLIGYRRNLVKKIGEDSVNWVEENRHIVKRWTRSELIEIIEKYK